MNVHDLTDEDVERLVAEAQRERVMKMRAGGGNRLVIEVDERGEFTVEVQRLLDGEWETFGIATMGGATTVEVSK